jgi:hypothetical protein
MQYFHEVMSGIEEYKPMGISGTAGFIQYHSNYGVVMVLVYTHRYVRKPDPRVTCGITHSATTCFSVHGNQDGCAASCKLTQDTGTHGEQVQCARVKVSCIKDIPYMASTLLYLVICHTVYLLMTLGCEFHQVLTGTDL